MVTEDDQWGQISKEVPGEISEYASYKERLAGLADALYAYLLFDDKLSQKMERLYIYAGMRPDEDTTVQRYQDMFSGAQTLSYRTAGNSSFLVPEILSIDREFLEQYMAVDNGIDHFKWALGIILVRQDHTLFDEIEELLTQSYGATRSASQVSTMFDNVDVRFLAITGEGGEGIQIIHGNYISLMGDQDRRICKDVFGGLYSMYKQFSDTLTAASSSNMKQTVFYAKAKKYASSREYYLANNEVPELVYDNLVEAAWENVVKLYEYTRIRGDMLGVDELHMHDPYVPMVVMADRRYTYEEAKSIVLEGLAPLGEEYLSLLRQGFGSQWIDVCKSEDKRSGTYPRGTYGSYPYMLLSLHGTSNDMFTLACKMGYSIHTWYSDRSQPFTYAGYKIFVAETASTCGEILLIRHLLKKAGSRKEKAYLLNHFLESFRRTLLRQTMLVELEDMAHKRTVGGESLTVESLYGIYRQLSADYFGSTMTADRQVDYEWERIPHFYTPFYAYQYATRFSAAMAINSRIMSREPGALEGYKKFLGGDCSMEPIDLLKLCGVGISTTRPVDEALGFFGELIEEFKRCIHTNK